MLFRKRILTLCSVFPLLFTSNIVKAEVLEDNCELIMEQEQEIGDTTVKVQKYNDNGVIVTTISGAESRQEKEEIVNYSNNIAILASTTADPTGPDEKWAPVRSLSSGTSYASASNSAQAHSYANFQAYSYGLDFRIKVSGGNTVAYWMESGNAKKIVLRQVYYSKKTGVCPSFSISWPISFGISPTNEVDTYEWVSSDYEKIWHCSAPHESVTTTGYSALFSAYVRDGADIYVGTTCYKVRCETIGGSQRKLYYGSNY